jgi:hypothetical protein
MGCRSSLFYYLSPSSSLPSIIKGQCHKKNLKLSANLNGVQVFSFLLSISFLFLTFYNKEELKVIFISEWGCRSADKGAISQQIFMTTLTTKGILI